MFPPTLPLVSYEDPGRLGRLLVRVREEFDNRAEHLIRGRWKTVEEAREIVGFCRALQWIITTSEDLTRPDEDMNTGN